MEPILLNKLPMGENEETIVYSFIQQTFTNFSTVLQFIVVAHMIKIQPLFSNSSQPHEFAHGKCHLDSDLHMVIVLNEYLLVTDRMNTKETMKLSDCKSSL